MKRSMMKTLVEWKQKEKRMPLIMCECRQVGKTYLIREFGRAHYDACVEINFEREKEYVDIFKKIRNPKELLVYFR